MDPVGPMCIPWEWEIPILFRANGKEHGNGLMALGGNQNTTFSIPYSEQANKPN